MKESTLIKISVALSCTGLIMLLCLNFIDFDTKHICDLDKYVGSYVKVCGNVTSLRFAKGHTFFKLYDGDSVDVVIFNKEINLSGNICIRGKVQIYKGKIEIVGYV